ncbi:acyltransferase domain-containing protein [Nocardia salmonicida]|uniref:acyltransferase domain-containing protein n=1 Tax=Nocardia salmonicida TaxID=53431 RepID=UPI0007A481BB|nr:acyltransferase domain-containing protein [Nocardia salmonicida]
MPDVLVGHSLGEIAALVAGGAFTVGEGAEIVYARSQSLRMAADTGEMFAARCEAQRARALGDLMECDSLVVAVASGSHQTVLSGPLETLSRVETIVREAGLSGSRIPSPYPFHSPLLASVAEDFRQRLETNTNLSQRPLRRAVYSPILGRLYNDDDEVAELLASDLVLPVRFRAALRHLHGT